MRYRKLPVSLKRRVHEYYYQRYHGQMFSEEKIINDLSHALREVRFSWQQAGEYIHNYSFVYNAYVMHHTIAI